MKQNKSKVVVVLTIFFTFILLSGAVNAQSFFGYRDFLSQGIEKVRGEFDLICIAHNIKKIHKHVISKEGGSVFGIYGAK